MQIKSFKAPTLKEAMANVKAELGADAVILHTNKIKKGGILGFHSKEIIEVIAAVEDEAVVPAKRENASREVAAMDTRAASEAVLQAAAAARASKNTEEAVEPLPTESFTPRNMVNQYQVAGTMEAINQAMAKDEESQDFGEILANASKAQEQEAAAPAGEGQQEQMPSEKSEAGVAAATEPGIPAAEEGESPVSEDAKEQEIENLQNQLAEMKYLLEEMSKNTAQGTVPPTLQSAMQNQGVSQRVVDDMVSKLNGTEIFAPKNSVKARKALEKYIRKAIRIANGITLYSDKPKVVALIGPTGVGKTTTLAKIAARFVLEQGAKVALITADTYRISAVEQLKTYSDILGLPLEIVYNPQALKDAIEKHKDKQLILLDTAGRSQYNTYQMDELKELLDIDVDIEKHLVMSATTKTSDGMELLENFSCCRPDRVIFTKVDETMSHGLILNILHRRKAALSYLTNGQSVPDDMEPASPERLAELLLREKNG